jgi:hypothetical protein
MNPRKMLAVAVLNVLATGPLSFSSVADNPSRVVESWRTEGGWLTELRQHANGARVCTTGKGFNNPYPFGISVVRSGETNVIVLVDNQQPPTSAGVMRLWLAGEPRGEFKTQIEGPAWATEEQESAAASRLFASLSPGTLAISVAGRQYEADLTGIGAARTQLQTCETLAGKVS